MNARPHGTSTEVSLEAEILALNGLLQQVTAQIPGMVFQYRVRADGSTCFPYASEGMRDILSVEPDAFRDDASSAFAHVHPDDIAALHESIAKSALTARQWCQRFRIQVGNGPLRWVQGHSTPQKQADGGCLWHGFITDVTQEVATEDNLRIAASVFENAREGIVIADAGGFITDVNPAFTRITGYTRDEVVGRSPMLLRSGHQDSAFYERMWQSIAETGSWRGEVWNRTKGGAVYPELLSVASVKNVAGQTSHLIGTFFDITDLEDQEAQLHRIAHYDPLTGLPNRHLMADRIRQAIKNTNRAGKIIALCVLGLDNLQVINDRLGFAVGDQALVAVARRVSDCMGKFDTVARRGGDEFVLLLQNLDWVEACDSVLSRLLEKVTADLTIDGQTVMVSATIGVTLFPQDNHPPEVLLRHADQARAKAKQAGANEYQLFNPEHDRLVREYRRLIEDLTVALQENQFVLHYQPKVNMAVGQVLGVEALIRWRHPERGLLAPAEFLYATTHNALAIPLGYWVLEQALKQLALWKAQGLNMPISVNLSPRLLLDEDFATCLATLLTNHPMATRSDLEIELLDSGAIVNQANATAAIHSCRALGVRVAVDDFGSGYATLSYFRHLPVDLLKIDQAFVRDMCDDAEALAIVEGSIQIAKGFNREVVAKGVETVEQGKRLIQIGCHVAQGYAIARPMAADEVPHWIESWSWHPM